MGNIERDFAKLLVLVIGTVTFLEVLKRPEGIKALGKLALATPGAFATAVRGN